ncbi:MAG: lipid IV(A) 3-deoxy-D-manno-octulosonic acid transferase [Plesiomonas sp.]
MPRALYSLLLYLIQPLIWLRLFLRGQKAPAYRQRWSERYALCMTRRAKLPSGGILLHSVSVGETLAAIPLVRALQSRYPALPITITTMTPTGSERVTATFGQQVSHCYLPYDLPDVMARFYRHLQPVLVVVMETELWPNMIHQAHQRGIPLIVANARLSERSAKGYGKIRSLMAQTLPEITQIAAQTTDDGARFIQLGLPKSHLTITGSIKFDISVSPELHVQSQQLRQQWAAQRLVWIAASTHQGEESLILQAHQALLHTHPDLLLIIVPRHPERFAEVIAQTVGTGLSCITRSSGDIPTSATHVVIGDSMGELMLLYGIADIAFVGGSLIERGGHNPLEPAAHGIPIIMGPHRFNFKEIGEKLTTAQTLTTVSDAHSLTTTLQQLLQDSALRTTQGHNALAVLKQNQGALERLLQVIDQHLSQQGNRS